MQRKAASRPDAPVEVPLLDLKPQYHGIREEVLEAIAAVCESQRFILGPAVKELEQKIAAYAQCGYGCGVSSGTDALLLALMTVGVGPGDEVLTTPYSFFATGGVVARLNARPLFCDIDPATYNISPAALEQVIATQCEQRDGRLVNRRTGGTVKALVPVHLYGLTADMDPLMTVARRHGLRVIEDAAQAIGAEYPGGRRAGSFGDIGCFSFFPSKNLGAFGDAGMCVTNDAGLAERLDVLRVHGGKPKYHHAVIGGNFRIDELQAAVLVVKLKYLDQWTEGRQQNAQFYDRAFAAAGLSQVQTPPVPAGYRHIYNQYVIRAEQRDELRAYLAEAKVGSEIYYPIPLHLQGCFADLGFGKGDFPESERAAAQTLALPIYPELTEQQLSYVVEKIAEFYRQ